MSATTTQLREAYVQGLNDQRGLDCSYGETCAWERCKANWEKAKRRYPTPTITRPREVIAITTKRPLRVVAGRVQYQDSQTGWTDSRFNDTTGARLFQLHSPAMLQQIVDLYANPTETVEVGE